MSQPSKNAADTAKLPAVTQGIYTGIPWSGGLISDWWPIG